MIPKRTAEFDAFGPWILPVHSTDEIPLLFRQAVDLSTVRLALKIPRPIERRNANPLMNLYDRLLLLRDEHLEILTRVPYVHETFKRQQITWRNLLAIEQSVDLLAGQLRLYLTSGEVVTIPFSAVSESLIDDLVDQLPGFFNQSPAFDQAKQPASRLDRSALSEQDISMINRFTAMQERHPQLQPHYIRQRQPVTRQGGVFAKFMDIVRSAQLNAVIVATHGNNLVLLHRKRTGLEHLKVPEFSLAYTVIPRRVVKLEESAFPGWEGVRQIQLAPTSITFLTVANDGLANALQQLL